MRGVPERREEVRRWCEEGRVGVYGASGSEADEEDERSVGRAEMEER